MYTYLNRDSTAFRKLGSATDLHKCIQILRGATHRGVEAYIVSVRTRLGEEAIDICCNSIATVMLLRCQKLRFVGLLAPLIHKQQQREEFSGGIVEMRWHLLLGTNC